MIYLLLKISGEHEAIIQEEIQSIDNAADIEYVIEMIKKERKVSDVEVLSYKNMEHSLLYKGKDVQYVVKYLDKTKKVVCYQDILVPEGIVSFNALSQLVEHIHKEYQVNELYLLDWQVNGLYEQGVEDE